MKTEKTENKKLEQDEIIPVQVPVICSEAKPLCEQIDEFNKILDDGINLAVKKLKTDKDYIFGETNRDIIELMRIIKQEFNKIFVSKSEPSGI